MSTIFLIFVVAILAARSELQMLTQKTVQLPRLRSMSAVRRARLRRSVRPGVQMAAGFHVPNTWSRARSTNPCSCIWSSLRSILRFSAMESPVYPWGSSTTAIPVKVWMSLAGRLCSDGIEYPNAGPRGDWPASGGGNVVTWITRQETRLGNDGVHAVVGAFSVYAYSSDQMRITPNRNLDGGSSFALANCQGSEKHPIRWRPWVGQDSEPRGSIPVLSPNPASVRWSQLDTGFIPMHRILFAAPPKLVSICRRREMLHSRFTIYAGDLCVC